MEELGKGGPNISSKIGSRGAESTCDGGTPPQAWHRERTGGGRMPCFAENLLGPGHGHCMRLAGNQPGGA